jgi:sugar/nucleoside kinase (ribokinase family)
MRLPTLPSLGPERTFDVIALGLNSLDMVAVVPHHPSPGGKTRIERFATLPGGQSASAAVGCARLGWKTQYIGTFGDDDAARIGIESLERDQVDTSLVRRIPNATSHTSLVLVDVRSGDRTVIWYRDPRLAMSAEDVPVDAISKGRVLLVDDHEPLAATVAARAAREAGVRTVIDVEKLRPGTEELLQHIDVIIAAEHLPSELTGLPDLGAAPTPVPRSDRKAACRSSMARKSARRHSRYTSRTRPARATPSGQASFQAGCERAPIRTSTTSCATPTASRR